MPLEGLHGQAILVTGATGFIGAHLVDRLRRVPDIRLLLLSRRARPRDHPAGETWVTASLAEVTERTWRAAGFAGIDVVFHLGGFIPKAASQADDVARVYEDNLIGTRALIESLPNPPGQFLYASTVDVYAAPRDGERLDEGSPLGPSGLYGASKLFCEQLIAGWACRAGCGCAVLRYGHIYGPGESSSRKLIPQTIRSLLRGEPPVLVGGGRVERDYLYVGDAVEATLRAAAGPPDPGPITINIVSGHSRPIRQIVALLTQLTGYDGPVASVAEEAPGRSLRCDPRRMRARLGDWPLVPLEEGLRREVEAMRHENPTPPDLVPAAAAPPIPPSLGPVGPLTKAG
jgi:nucleoside-diphosphate-sugar epimerase